MIKQLSLSLTLVVLLVSVAAQAYQALQPQPVPTKLQPLKKSLPMRLPGWRVKDLPLGDTEAVRQRVNELLQLDDYAYREFTQNDLKFSVYIAYWEPGKMPVRLVNTHNPDRCWTTAGWNCTAMKFDLTKTLDNREFQPAQWRIFEKDSHQQHVLFWHIVENRVYSYNQFNDLPPLTVVLQDLMNKGFRQKREQYFVRVNSEQPFDRLWDKPGFQRIMHALMDICLALPEEKEEPIYPKNRRGNR